MGRRTSGKDQLPSPEKERRKSEPVKPRKPTRPKTEGAIAPADAQPVLGLSGLAEAQKAQEERDSAAEAAVESVEAGLAQSCSGLIKVQADIAKALADKAGAKGEGVSVQQVRAMIAEAEQAQKAATDALAAWESMLADDAEDERTNSRTLRSSRQLIGQLASTLDTLKSKLSSRVLPEQAGTPKTKAKRSKRPPPAAAAGGEASGGDAKAPADAAEKVAAQPSQPKVGADASAARKAPVAAKGGLQVPGGAADRSGGKQAAANTKLNDIEEEEESRVSSKASSKDSRAGSKDSACGVASQTSVLDWVGKDSAPPAFALVFSQSYKCSGLSSQRRPEEASAGANAGSGESTMLSTAPTAATPTASPKKPKASPTDDTSSVISNNASNTSKAASGSEKASGSIAARLAANPDNPEIMVQVLLENSEWADSSPAELKQIVYHLAGGEAKFSIAARGHMYVIDFTNPEGATQMNATTGTVRQLRVIDLQDDAETFATTTEPRAAGIRVPTKAGDGFHSNDPDDDATDDAPKGPEAELQRKYGPQSKRGAAPQYQLSVLDHNPHARECFARLAANEDHMCEEWAVFYHSYSFAALVYEVHAAVGAVLFRFRSQYSSLPRLLAGEFATTPSATALLGRFDKEFSRKLKDHHPEFRKVAISAMCSLVALGPEASTPVVFVSGYSEKDLNFRSVLEGLLASCYVPKAKIKRLADRIIALSEQHGLDVSQFGGKPCGSRNAGHLLQIFIRRHLVDALAYASQPYGVLDHERHPLSSWLSGDVNANYGQVRILAHPKMFMSAKHVRMYVASADPTFHRNRRTFQEELTKLMDPVLGDPDVRQKAATGIWGGTLPAWWTRQDQRMHTAGSAMSGSTTDTPAKVGRLLTPDRATSSRGFSMFRRGRSVNSSGS